MSIEPNVLYNDFSESLGQRYFTTRRALARVLRLRCASRNHVFANTLKWREFIDYRDTSLIRWDTCIKNCLGY